MANKNNRTGNKLSQNIIGFCFVPKAGTWMFYHRNNNGTADKVEWFSSEAEAKDHFASYPKPTSRFAIV